MDDKRPLLTKSQWNDRYHILDKAHSDFLLEYPRSKNGRNAEIRAIAEKKADRAISMSRMLIEGDSELSAFFASTEHSSMYRQDEFFQARHFGSDMTGLLKDLRRHIDSLPDDPSPER